MVVYVALDVLYIALLAQCAAVSGLVGHVVALDGGKASSRDSVSAVGCCLGMPSYFDPYDPQPTVARLM